MQICRYNIGGSGWGTADVKNFRYGANIERCAATTHQAIKPKQERPLIPGIFGPHGKHVWQGCIKLAMCCRAEFCPGTPHHVDGLMWGAGGVRSFWGPSGEWDWDADAGQVWVLLAARARGACVFEAFSNSPPFWMTVSGRASGNRLPILGNLRPEREAQFVEYLVAVLGWFHKTHSLLFRYIHVHDVASSSVQRAMAACMRIVTAYVCT